jgi:hypothetical protein
VEAGGGEIAHLKMFLAPGDGTGEIGVLNLVRNDQAPEQPYTLPAPLASGELVLNLRAELAPDPLRDAVRDAFARSAAERALTFALKNLECFRPGKPRKPPTRP